MSLIRDIRTWAMQTMGIGVGEMFFLVTAKTSADAYYTLLAEKRIPDSKIFTTLATAEDAMTGSRNDVLFVYPGLHTQITEVGWDKSNTHLVGLGGPNVMGRNLRPNVMLYANTAAMGYNLNLTGNNCQFRNIAIQSGTSTTDTADATSYGPMKVNGYGNYFSKVQLRGINTAKQLAAVACSSLEISDNGDFPLFEDCIIGQNTFGGTRTTASQGHIKFTGTATPSPQNGTFKRCLMLNRTDSDCPMVVNSAYGGMDRLWLFEDCYFENWSTNWAATAPYVFENSVMIQASEVRLVNCTASGYDQWETTVHGGKWVMTYGAVGVGSAGHMKISNVAIGS